MHFTTLYIMKGYKAEDLSKDEIEVDFMKKYCYCCGDTEAEIRDWCDWFLIGGRWNDMQVIVTKKGYKYGENGIGNGYKEPTISVANISDIEDIEADMIYAVADEQDVYAQDENKEKFDDLINQIKKHEIDGVVVLIDCHD